jgi:Bacterial regulatory proteins, tetR family
VALSASDSDGLRPAVQSAGDGHDLRLRTGRAARSAGRTRARIIAAAARQFLACGYAAATMRAAAADAGVSLPTVELAFGTKARLLKGGDRHRDRRR